MVSVQTARVLLCLCSVTALVISTSDQSEDPCSTNRINDITQLKCLQEATQCASNETSPWRDSQIAGLLDSVRTLADVLEKLQLKFCKFDFPNENPEDVTARKSCPSPYVHKNGGLACATVKQTHYCKPMCNQGYDFSFLRKSRPYEKCSKDTEYKWTTQYIGGSRLAECIESSIPVSGSSTAYFPQNQDCLKTGKVDKKGVFDDLAKDLGINQSEIKNACLICG